MRFVTHRRASVVTGPPSRHDRADGAIGFLAGASAGHFAVQAQISTLNITVVQMAGDLAVSGSSVRWIVNVYLASLAAFILPAGLLADRLRAGGVYGAGLAVFASASLATAVSPTLELLVLAQVVQGVGSALLLPGSVALLSQRSELGLMPRSTAIAWWTAIGGASAAVSPVLAGVVSELASWRATFVVNALWASLGLAFTALPAPPRSTGQSGDPRPKDDGAHASDVSETLEQQRASGASEPALNTLRRLRTMAKPRSMTALHLLLVGFTTSFAYYGVVYVLSFYLQVGQGLGPTMTGILFVSLNLTFAVAHVCSGFLARRYGAIVPLISGLLLAALGNAALFASVAAATDSMALIALCLVPIGLAGLASPAATELLLAVFGRARSGLASALLTMARQGGGALGIALLGGLGSGGRQDTVSSLGRASLIAFALLAAVSLITYSARKEYAATARR